MGRYVCWLIERGQVVGHEPTLWWADSRYPDSELGRWTRIAADAMRFPTMEAARHYADIYAGPHCTVTEHVFLDRESVPVDVIGLVVDEFLRWPLPRSVCSDPCASTPGFPNRTGTNLLTANEARQMFEHLIGKVPRAADRFERAATASQFQRAERAEAQLAELWKDVALYKQQLAARDAEIVRLAAHAASLRRYIESDAFECPTAVADYDRDYPPDDSAELRAGRKP